MPTLDATVAGSNANTYATLAEFNTFIGELTSAGTAATATDALKQAALIQSARRLDLETWDGSPVTTTQRLQFPRSGLIDTNGFGVAVETIPRFVREGQMQLAVEMLNADGDAATNREQFESLKVGSLEIKYRQGESYGANLGDSLPDSVLKLISPYITGGTQSALIRG